jgi:hypothetical protein
MSSPVRLPPARWVTKTAAFRRWFGDSKVVDENGEPLVVYHGTQGDFSEFRDDIEGRAGYYFTADKQFANSFAEGYGANVMPVYLSISKPADLRRGVPGSVYDALETQGYSRLVELYESDPDEIWNFLDGDSELAEALGRAGYDGMRLSEPAGRREVFSWVAFRPEQIKSAIGNRGTFNPDSPSMLEQEGTPFNLDMGRRTGAYEQVVEQPSAQTDTPEFRRWFGDSKVVDENGEPLVVYHGTKKSAKGRVDISAFKPLTWVTEQPRYAAVYAEGTPRRLQGAVYPLYVSIKNPFVVTRATLQGSTVRDILGDLTPEELANDKRLIPTFERLQDTRILAAIEAAGFDGVKANEFGNTTWLAFRPEQIKSAIGNSGTFDPDDPNILADRTKKRDDVTADVGSDAVRQDRAALPRLKAGASRGVGADIDLWEQGGRADAADPEACESSKWRAAG